MAVTSPEQFLRLLERSKLLDEERLAQAREAASDAKDATALAKALARKGVLSWWQAGKLLAGRTTFLVGKYKLIDLLGSGGMGRVFLAEHTTMNRPVALKIISKRLGRDPATLKLFFDEARAIAALNHRNIVHSYDVDSEGDHYYMVMEFVEGQDLQRMVEAKGPLPFDRAAQYIQQAADGLAHAHDRKMIHCDIKPANLLVNKSDEVKILDMGMARLIDRAKAPASGKDERSLGTVDYLAPEQAVESPQLDHRADVYSLGCTLYFLLTGKPPFPEGTLHERIVKHQTDQPRAMAELRPDAPEPLAEICRKMMAKDPDARYQSADEVSQALGQWLASYEAEAEPVLIGVEPEGAAAGLRISAESPSAVRRPARKPSLLAGAAAEFTGPRRMLWFAGLGGAVALVLVVGLIFFFLAGPGGEADEERGEEVAAAEAGESAAKPTGETVPEPEKVKEDSEFPDLPDLGNLRNFDPEAAFAKEPEDSQKTEAKQPETAAGDEGSQTRPVAGKKQEGQAAAVEKPAPDKTEDEKPQPPEPKPKEKEPEKKEPEQKEPEEKPPPKKEAPKPPPTDPLKGLPDSFDLPEASLTGGEPAEAVSIGQIDSGPDDEWQLYLLGGENALRGNRAFVLQQQEADPSKAQWQVQLETPKASGEPVREAVASLWRDGDALRFEWTEKPGSLVNNLRNCILQVRVAGKSKYVTLTEPKTIDPILIDLERPSINVDLPVKWLPDPANLRVQITRVEGREGHVIEPAEPADFKTPVILSFPRTNRDGNTTDRVAFRLSFTRGGKLQLTEPRREWFQRYRVNAEGLRNTAQTERDRLDKELHPPRGEPPRGPKALELKEALRLVEMELWYVNFYLDVHQKAQIHFRVYTEVDGREVLLVLTQPAEQPVAADSKDPPET